MKVLLHNQDTDALAARLAARFPEVEAQTCNSYVALPTALAQGRPDAVYSVRFDGTPGFPKDALLGPEGPAWIANGGVGTDHLGQWDTSKVTVTNAAGVAADMMAEYILGGFLNLTLDLPGLAASKAKRDWSPRLMRPLKGATLLIIGLGHTGRALAARAKAFGMTVIGTRARPVEMPGVEQVYGAKDLHTALPRADFIALATPLTPQTRGLLDADAFAKMKPGVILADVSRGGVIVEAALVEAVRNGTVAGAVLDVFETEPLPKESALWDLPNVLISPHCSSVYEGWEIASFDLFLDNLERWQNGEPLENVVDPGRGY